MVPGYGPDGTIWGIPPFVKGNQYQRLAHIHAAPLPGGEKAVSEPWRQALWYIFVIIMAMISLCISRVDERTSKGMGNFR